MGGTFGIPSPFYAIMLYFSVEIEISGYQRSLFPIAIPGITVKNAAAIPARKAEFNATGHKAGHSCYMPRYDAAAAALRWVRLMKLRFVCVISFRQKWQYRNRTIDARVATREEEVSGDR